MAPHGLLMITALSYLVMFGVKGQSNSCPCNQSTSSCVTCGAQPGCANVTTAPYSLFNAVYQSSPFYEPASTSNILYSNIDNACTTFFAIDKKTFLAIRSIVSTSGANVIQKYIAAEVEECPGSYRIQGLFLDSGCSSFVDQQCVLGEACQGTFVVYRCNLYKGSNAIVLPDTDNRIVFSSSKKLTPCCYKKAVAIGNSQKFNYYQYSQAPNNFSAQCVTYFNGAPCINYQNVPACAQKSIP